MMEQTLSQVACRSEIKTYLSINPTIVWRIADLLRETPTYSRMFQVHQMLTLLIETPNKCFLCVSEKNDEIIGFFFAYIKDGRNFSWVETAWASPKLPHCCVKMVWEMFVDWSLRKEKHYVRTATDRPEAMCRAYDFKPIRTILEKEI